MKPYLVKTPKLIKFLFKNRVWSFTKKEKTLYLTFDDGPTPEITEWTLHQLQKYNAKATFFCVGKNIDEHFEIYTKIIKNGHSIGNHTYNHLNDSITEAQAYIDNIEKAEITINRSKQLSSKLFRPPYGRLKYSQSIKIRKLGYKIIMWDVLSADFDTSISKEKCLENVIRNTENGSVILFHDSNKASKNLKFVLPKILEYYTEKGFTFKKLN
ncbi:polysaccharide deacetylase family protein [Lutibacter sp.]